MSKSKLTLIVDGNWLLMSRLCVLNSRYQDDTTLMHDLKLLLIKSINVVLRTFPKIDNIIFVTDGGSWRKHLEIPRCLHHELNGELVEYKGTRVKGDDIDWDLLFGAFNEFTELISSTGITTCSEHHVEGDDWCWYWSTKLNKEGTNVILWSKDRDLIQLVHTNPATKCFTVWWNKDNGIMVEDIENDPDDITWLFNLEGKENNDLLDMLMKKSNKISQVKPKDIVVDKIFMGDMSDNIFPLMLRKSKTPSIDKKFRISRKDLDLNVDITNEKQIQEYMESFYNKKGYSDRLINPIDEEIEHFEYNKRLVWLDESSYPDEILELMRQHNKYNLCKDFSIAESKIQSEENNLDSILETI